MNNIMKRIILSVTMLSLFLMTIAIYGQDDESSNRKLTVDVGADLVSSYVWRGMYQTGASIQPALSLSAFGFTLGTWGSTDFSTLSKEVDFYLSYEFKGFTASIGDFWWLGEGASYFRNAGSHHLEAGLGFTFPEKFPLSLGVYTMLTGNEDKDEDDRRFYSTYISASFPFSIGKVDCETGIGVTPRKGMYSDKFDIVTISAKATKNLQLSTEYNLPVFVELIFSPTQDNVFLVFGIQF